MASPLPGLRGPCPAAGSFYKAFYHWHHMCRSTNKIATRQYSRGRTTSSISTCSNPRHTSSATAAAEEKPSSTPTPSRQASHLRKHTSNINTHPDLSSHMRHIMRKVPHPVVVITAAAPTTEEASKAPASAESTFRGMTVSSFNTVTLEPAPLVSFNVRTPSATHSAMILSGTFLAHFLLSTPEGARIADAFAKGGNVQGEVFQQLAVGSRNREVDVFAGRGTQGAPLIAGSGVLQVLRCKPLEGKEIVVGDHRVVVAEVMGILAKPGKKEAAAGDGTGVMYGDQRYWSLGQSIDLGDDRSGSDHNAGKKDPMQQTIGLNVRRGDEYDR